MFGFVADVGKLVEGVMNRWHKMKWFQQSCTTLHEAFVGLKYDKFEGIMPSGLAFAITFDVVNEHFLYILKHITYSVKHVNLYIIPSHLYYKVAKNANFCIGLPHCVHTIQPWVIKFGAFLGHAIGNYYIQFH